MKNLLLILLSLVFINVVDAQTPQGLNYQAVARTPQGQPLANQNVNVKFSILNGSVDGTVIYIEDHLGAATNAYGLFNLTIGKGTATIGTFSAIDWSNGTKFLKVEISNILVGTTQLLSVPYALYAKKVETESQTLSVNGTQLSISQGNTVSIPSTGGNSTISIQEIPIIRTADNGISSNYSSYSAITYSLNGNEIYLATSKGAIIELKKDATTGVYYKNRNIGIAGTGGNNFVMGKLVILNGDLYASFKNNNGNFAMAKVNLTSELSSNITFVGSTPPQIGSIYSDGTFLFIYNNSTTNYQKYQVSGTTLTDNGVAIVNIPFSASFSIQENSNILHLCFDNNLKPKLVITNASGSLISNKEIPFVDNVSEAFVNQESYQMLGVVKINSTQFYMAFTLSSLSNTQLNGTFPFLSKLYLYPITNP